MALTHTLLILIDSGFRDQSFLGAFSGTTGEKPEKNIGGERSVRGAAKDISAVLGLFPGVIGPC